MEPTSTFDAVVAGGGVAGSVAAAALAGEGLSVLVVEPGQNVERRLAGELIHPPGLQGLRSLGFGPVPEGVETVPIHGFAVFHEAGELRPPNVLPYVERGRPVEAMAIGHGPLRRHLAGHVAALPGVEAMDGTRIIGLELGAPGRTVVHLRQGVRDLRVSARIVIAADGAASAVRDMAGIGHRRQRLSTLVGFVCDRDALPMPGYGHVFLGGPSPVLAYGIDGRRARILFDLPIGPRGADRAAGVIGAAAALPAPLRRAVESAARAPLSHVSHDIAVDAVVRGPVALVGDAGGSCHPLTASGMTAAVADALGLQAALRARPGDLGAALALYGRRRRGVQRTRRLLARSLYEACSRDEPEMLVIRRGLDRYWREDARGRAASMALLAMGDVRLASVLREMTAVILHGAAPEGGRGAVAHLLQRPDLALGLSRLVARHVREAIQAR